MEHATEGRGRQHMEVERFNRGIYAMLFQWVAVASDLQKHSLE